MYLVYRVLIGLFLIGLTGCSSSGDFYLFTDDAPIPTLPVREINSAEITAVIQDIEVEYNKDRHLQLQQAKTFYADGITAIQLEFISQDIIEMKEARGLIVDLTESLLARLNQNPVLGVQFASYPFTSESLEIYIEFESYFGRYVDPYYIQWICMEDDIIGYYIFDLEDNMKRCWHVRKETYATSREIIVYQREAEKKYKESQKPVGAIFGAQRYLPEE